MSPVNAKRETERVVDPLTLPEAATIVVWPITPGVATPVLRPIIATLCTEDVQAVDGLVVITCIEPSVSFPVAVNAKVLAEGLMTAFCGVSPIDTSASGPTLTP